MRRDAASGNGHLKQRIFLAKRHAIARVGRSEENEFNSLIVYIFCKAMMMLWILCLVPLVWYGLFRYRRRRMYELAALIKGSNEELPFIGIAHRLVGDTQGELLVLRS